jgi:hypothetical protein
MNRNEIEGDPHSLIEGMVIGAFVTGASEGIIYVRAEYPLAVHRLRTAIQQAEEWGMLGDDILGRGFSFRLSLVEGAGAFVCGGETALIRSLEGRAGRPTPRPPLSGRVRPLRKAHQHQQRRNLVQHRAHRAERPGLVSGNRQREEPGHQSLLAGRQGGQHRPGRDAARNAAPEIRL